MSITSAMFTGVSGLLANAEGINVIGNNLANVNTIGFKSGRMLFSDLLSANIGNSSQIGRGTQIQKVDNIFSQNSFETTESVTDLAIQGNSFFAVMDPNATAPVNQNGAFLTRAGAFRLDSNNILVNPNGYQVLDTQGNPIKFNANSAAIETANTDIITASTPAASTISVEAAAQLTTASAFSLAIFTDAANAFSTQAGTIVADAGTFQGTVGGTAAEIVAQNTINTAAVAAQTAATAALAAPNATTVAAAQAAFNALTNLTNSSSSSFVTPTIITAYNTFKTALTTANTANATAATSSEISAAGAIQTAATAANSAAATAVTNPNAVTVAASQAAFNALNTLTNNSIFTTAAFTALYPAFQTSINISNTAVNAAMTTAAPLIATAQTALAAAESVAFSKITSIDPSGLITYLAKDGITTNYYNGSGQLGVAANVVNATTVQRLAVVTVANTGGLDKAGSTLFKPTTASGISSDAFSLANNSANGSSEMIYTNSLEQSNVDMAGQFVKMILTQRAYSANSKTITTADEMTQEVLNLKR